MQKKLLITFKELFLYLSENIQGVKKIGTNVEETDIEGEIIATDIFELEVDIALGDTVEKALSEKFNLFKRCNHTDKVVFLIEFIDIIDFIADILKLELTEIYDITEVNINNNFEEALVIQMV